MKKIFERILKLVESLEDNSQTAFAKKIGCQQSTFNGYMNEEGQRKIRLILLEDILKVYPQISREWLYFGEGTMLKEGKSEKEPSRSPRISELETTPNDRMFQLECKNEELTEKLFATKDELLETKNELLASKDKIIALHEENKRLAESMSAVVTSTEAR
ncbi:hypothetical protein [Bilophila wadsworthia]|uniref:hypothetical protein n=1 Tax=Bilophila wadsworthia TaxID=35833 RepID=UPI003260FEC9